MTFSQLYPRRAVGTDAAASCSAPALRSQSFRKAGYLQVAWTTRCNDRRALRRVATCSKRAQGRGSTQHSARKSPSAEMTYGGLLVNKLVTGSRDVDVELFGLSSSDCRRLAASFKQAKTWHELSAILPHTMQEWTGVDAACLVSAFSSLARVAPASLRTSPSPSLRTSPTDLLTRAEISSALSLLNQLAAPRLPDLDAQGLVTLIVSLAKMQDLFPSAKDPPRVDHAILETNSHSTQAPTAPSAPTSSSSSAATAAAGAALIPSLSLGCTIAQLLDLSLDLMPHFTPQSLANLIWALATLNHQPSGAWLTEYYRRLDEQIEALGSRDVSNILWSLCKLDLMPDLWLRDSLVERALEAVKEQQLMDQQHQGQQGRMQTQGGGAAGAGGGGSSVTQGQGQDRATLIQCLARWYFLYNYRPPDEWIAEYLRLVQPSLGAYLPFDLVSLVHSCVVMNYQPSRSWMTAYYRSVMHSLRNDSTLSTGDLQRLMWALSRIDFTPPLTWQREFVAVSVPKLRHLQMRALSEMIWALACWDCRPSPEWLAEFFNATGPHLYGARPQHISCQLSALAKLEVRVPGPWLDEALEAFVDQLADAKAHDLVTLLETITVVCVDKAWLSSHTNTIKHLADTAASKFAVYDAVMHTKLCVALAAANVCPAADWLKKQQAALVSCLRGGDSDSQAAAQGLREVYRTWGAEVDTELKPFL